ncbi:hypothetical protein ACQPYK_18240 [Streptosporangium sp. CA-135522]|uniref:hypothetical protein n=1 Tax=Streptosporangium sp. CA-135522 TaxID=3240072 RepID=UPI003D8BDF5C
MESLFSAERRRGGVLTSRKDGRTVLPRADKQASAALAEMQAFPWCGSAAVVWHCC